MIQLQNISKTYQSKKRRPVQALRGVSLCLQPRGLLFFLGKSGSGKTTLLNLLGGLDRPTDGEILIEGRTLDSYSEKEMNAYRNTCVGFIFQERNLLEELTVEENLALVLRMQKEEVTAERIAKALETVELSGYEKRRCKELSGGQRQRVTIARALIKQPRVILADEPTAALDSETADQIFRLLKKIGEEHLVIVVSHDRDSASWYADRVIELQDGEIVKDSQKETSVEKTDFQIKSAKFPFLYIWKLGISELLRRKFYFAGLTLISAVALVMAALIFTFQFYERDTALADTLASSDTKVAMLQKEKFADKKDTWYDDGYYLTDSDIDALKDKIRQPFKGVYVPVLESMNIEQNYESTLHLDGDEGTVLSKLSGFAEMTEVELPQYGFGIAKGRMPDGNADEIAVTKELFESFKKCGYRNYRGKNYVMQNSLDGTEVTFTWDELLKDENIIDKWYEREDGLDWGGTFEYPYNLMTKHIGTYDDLIGESIFIAGRNYKITAVLTDTFDVPDLVFVGKGKVEQIATLYPQAVETDTLLLKGTTKQTEEEEGAFSFETRIIGKSKALKGHEMLLSDEGMSSEHIALLKDAEVDVTVSYQDGHAVYGGRDFRVKISPVRYGIREEHFGLHKTALVSEEFFEQIAEGRGGTYLFAIGKLPDSSKEIQGYLKACESRELGVRYKLQGTHVDRIAYLDGLLEAFRRIAVYPATAIGLFAIFLFYRFLSMSIRHRRKEIGILRALGADKRSVYLLFLTEGLVIAACVFLCSAIGSFAAVKGANTILQNKMGLGICLFHYDIKQVIILLVFSFVAAGASTVLSVRGMLKRELVELLQ